MHMQALIYTTHVYRIYRDENKKLRKYLPTFILLN